MKNFSVAQAVVLPQFRAIEHDRAFYIQVLVYDDRCIGNPWSYKFLQEGEFGPFVTHDIVDAKRFSRYGEAVKHLNTLHEESSTMGM